MFTRILASTLTQALEKSQKVIIIYGARQTGKTTLCNSVLSNLGGKQLHLTGDDLSHVARLSGASRQNLELLTSGYNLVFFDEAQRFPDIGRSLKLLHDHNPSLKILVTGSASLEIAAHTRESLAGRTKTFQLHPISVLEYLPGATPYELSEKLEALLLFGSYPEVLTLGNAQEKIKHLEELCESVLYKDLEDLLFIRNKTKLRNLLKLLAYQIGNLVSLNELATQLQLARETVGHYISLLEEAFIIFRLPGFSRNLRKEITKMDKIYFTDLGIRNALINNFSPLHLRPDTGALWENFVIMERKKFLQYSGYSFEHRFWRTHTGAELDLVEQRDGKLKGFEIKWTPQKRRAPNTWTSTYPEAEFHLVTPLNLLPFLQEPDPGHPHQA